MFGKAWSTIKVPLVIAAMRKQNTGPVTAPMTAAITESDNAAAESIWAGLGDPDNAATQVEAVLRETGTLQPLNPRGCGRRTPPSARPIGR